MKLSHYPGVGQGLFGDESKKTRYKKQETNNIQKDKTQSKNTRPLPFAMSAQANHSRQ
jgi:hypothetical protein